MPVASTEGSFAEYPEIGFTEPVVDSQTYLEDGIEFSTDGQWVLGLNQSLINDTLRVNEFFSTITDIRIASTNGVDTFQLKSVRIKDTLLHRPICRRGEHYAACLRQLGRWSGQRGIGRF